MRDARLSWRVPRPRLELGLGFGPVGAGVRGDKCPTFSQSAVRLDRRRLLLLLLRPYKPRRRRW